MSLTPTQNFYKETVTVAWATGAGNFYVSTKPTVSSGWLVLSPNNESLREIVKFTGTGTDGTGDYVTVLADDRGLGGTTEQTHEIGETVFMNVTAEAIQEISDAIDAIVAGGAQDASATTKGITKLNVAPATANNPIAVGYNDTTKLPTTGQKAYLNAVTGMITLYGGSTPPTGFLSCDGSAVSRTTYADLFAVISTNFGVGDGSTTFNLPDLRSSVPIGSGQKTKTFTFEDSDVTVGTDTIVVDSNQYLYTGQAVALTTSGTLPSGLSATTYYVIRVSATAIKLATSVANANEGTAVDITAASGGGTHTLTLTLTNRTIGDAGGEETHALTNAEMPSHTHTVDGAANTGGAAGGGSLALSNNTTSAAGSDSPHNNMPPFVTVNYIIKT